MVFKATRLMHDQLTLNRAKVNTARLQPDQVTDTPPEDAAAWTEWRERVRVGGKAR
jgi:hypothetical protein